MCVFVAASLGLGKGRWEREREGGYILGKEYTNSRSRRDVYNIICTSLMYRSELLRQQCTFPSSIHTTQCSFRSIDRVTY